MENLYGEQYIIVDLNFEFVTQKWIIIIVMGKTISYPSCFFGK